MGRQVGLLRDGPGKCPAQRCSPTGRSGGAAYGGQTGECHEIETGSGELWARCHAGDADARGALIERYLPLCRRIARATKVLPTPALGVDDLEAAGAVGLIQAIDRFAPDRGIPFAGYATLRIRGAILDEVRHLDDLSRAARQRAKDDNGNQTTMSLDLLQERGEVVDPTQLAEVDERAAQDDLREDVERALAAIPGRERSILASYYDEGLSLAAIGRRIGVSEARVSQLHSRAIVQLRMLLGVVATPTVRTARAAAA